MKHFLFALVFVASTQASAALNCQADLDLLKNDIGSCNFGDQAACDNVCFKLAPAASNISTVGCSGSELENARNRGRQEVLNDLRATAVRQESAYGVDEADCTARVSQRISMLRESAIRDCNDKAVSIKNCQIVGSARLTTATASAPSVKGTGQFELKKNASTEAQCKAGALERAKQNALDTCKIRVGYDCSINESSAIVTHKIDNGFLSKDKRKCQAEIVAIPPSNIRVQCTAEIKAINSAVGL